MLMKSDLGLEEEAANPLHRGIFASELKRNKPGS